MKLTSLTVWVLIGLFTVGTAAAEDVGNPDSWQFDLGLYLWYADIGAKSTAANDNEVEAKDLIDNLKMGFMGLLEVRKEKWSFLTDVIYLDVEDDGDIATGLRADVELSSWIVTPMITYRLAESERFECSALAGARYLSLNADLGLNSRAPLPPGQRSVSESEDNWDGIIGVRGNVNLSENWHLPFHLDIGTGSSDFTWQALAGIGYRFSRVDIVAGYRYLDWEFDDRTIADSLDVKGPYAGIKIRF